MAKTPMIILLVKRDSDPLSNSNNLVLKLKKKFRPSNIGEAKGISAIISRWNWLNSKKSNCSASDRQQARHHMKITDGAPPRDPTATIQIIKTVQPTAMFWKRCKLID